MQLPLENFAIHSRALIIATFCLLATACHTEATRLPPTVPQGPGMGQGEALTVPIQMGGKTLRFVVDTGCLVTTIDSRLESHLGASRGKTHERSLDGKTIIESKTFDCPALSIQGVALQTGRLVETDDLTLMRLVSGEPVDGILGMDCLQHYCLRLDFEAKEIRFLHGRLVSAATAGTRFDLFSPKNTGSYWAVADRLHGGAPDFNHLPENRTWDNVSALDTGNTGTAWLIHNLFKSAHDAGGGAIRQVPAATADGVRPFREARIAQCWFGPWEYHGLIVSEQRFNNIGLGFLGRHLVTIDFPRRRMFLKPLADATAPDPHAMTGTHLLRGDRGTAIYDVDPGSAAQDAGLQKSDILVSLDGKPVDAMAMWEIRQYLSSKAGQTFNLTVRRGDKVIHAALVPREF